MEKPIKTYKEFYPFYLSEHSHPLNRLMHFIGTTLVIILLIAAIWYQKPVLLLYIPLAGYGFAWIGHFFIEKNKPATFKYPLWSFISDFKMYFDILRGKIGFKS
jgi:hypothetical protein